MTIVFIYTYDYCYHYCRNVTIIFNIMLVLVIMNTLIVLFRAPPFVATMHCLRSEAEDLGGACEESTAELACVWSVHDTSTPVRRTNEVPRRPVQRVPTLPERPACARRIMSTAWCWP